MSSKLLDCLKDDSKMVRAEAVQLVGRYMTGHPDLVDQYFDTVLLCLSDDGVCLPRRVCVRFVRVNSLHIAPMDA